MSNSKTNLEGLEDNYLMKKVQDGDFSKMAILFDRHQGALFGFFYRMTNDASQSEDLLQNVFYRLLKYRKTYRNDGKFVYWMYAIARNVGKDFFRKNDPILVASDLEEAEDKMSETLTIQEKIEKGDKVALLKAALNKLDPEKREAIILSKYQGMKYHEIAQQANVTENAIKARVRRGLMELKDWMNKLEK